MRVQKYSSQVKGFATTLASDSGRNGMRKERRSLLLLAGQLDLGFVSLTINGQHMAHALHLD